MGVLLLRSPGSGRWSRRRLDVKTELAVTDASRGLVAFSVPLDEAVIVHEIDGRPVASWDREGALRLAQILPPACGRLAQSILERIRVDDVISER